MPQGRSAFVRTGTIFTGDRTIELHRDEIFKS